MRDHGYCRACYMILGLITYVALHLVVCEQNYTVAFELVITPVCLHYIILGLLFHADSCRFRSYLTTSIMLYRDLSHGPGAKHWRMEDSLCSLPLFPLICHLLAIFRTIPCMCRIVLYP